MEFIGWSDHFKSDDEVVAFLLAHDHGNGAQKRGWHGDGLQPTSTGNYIIREALGPSYKSNLSTILISLSVLAEFSSLFLVLAVYVHMDDTL